MTLLCINCVHYIDGKLGFSKCKRTEHIEPVKGKTDYIYCSDERRDYVGCCGPEAKFFEPVKTEVEVCQNCQKQPAEPDHLCPYSQDVNNDGETTCNCCDGCRHQCAMDI